MDWVVGIAAGIMFTTGFLAAVGALLATADASSRFSKHTELAHYSFEDYLRESGKKYDDSAEYSLRKNIFMKNLAEIRTHNAQNLSWKLGINKFTDQSQDEKSSYFGGDICKLA